MGKNENFDCMMKLCARCGLLRAMRTRDTVCDGCSNKLYRLLRRREENAAEIAKELKQANALLDKAHERLSRWIAEYPGEANLTIEVADEIKAFLGETLT